MIFEVGRFCFEVEVKELKVGNIDKKVVNNRLAIPITKDESTFIDIEAWDKNAERIGKYYKKGYEICLMGHLKNTKKKKRDVEYDCHVIVVDKIIPTYGNSRPIAFTEEDFLNPDNN